MSKIGEYDSEIFALNLEYSMTIAYRSIGRDCECAAYFIQRREVLIPVVLKKARETGSDPVDLFADFARKVHARHEGVSDEQ